jgi:hypothetical protein
MNTVEAWQAAIKERGIKKDFDSMEKFISGECKKYGKESKERRLVRH